MARYIQSALILCLLGSLACVSTALTKAQWTLTGPARYQFEDANLRISFAPQGGQFHWHFTNKRATPLTIDHKSLFFAISGDPNSYNLWGAAIENTPAIPHIEIKGGGFIAYQLPVSFKSPIRRLVTAADQEARLFFSARWGQEERSYQISFPFTEPEPETAPIPP